MARPAANPTARLARLDAARAKIAGLKRGETLSAIPMAKVLGVGWPSLREWCDTLPGFAESGAFVAGGNGVEYAFRPKKTLDFLTKYFRGVLDKQARESERLHKAINVKLSEPEPMSFVETRQLVEMGQTLQKARREAGELVDRSHVERLFGDFVDRVRSKTLGGATRVDPNGNWQPVHRAVFEEWARGLLLEIHGDSLELKAEFDARIGSTGIS